MRIGRVSTLPLRRPEVCNISHHLREMVKWRRSRGHIPETKQVDALATYKLASWELAQWSAGITFSWASCNCPFSSACVVSCYMLHVTSSMFAVSQHIQQMGPISHFALLLFSHKLKTASSKHKKVFVSSMTFNVCVSISFFWCDTQKCTEKQGDWNPANNPNYCTYIGLVNIPETFLQPLLSPPHTPHLSNFLFEFSLPSQPALMHFPWTHTAEVSGEQGVPSTTCMFWRQRIIGQRIQQLYKCRPS